MLIFFHLFSLPFPLVAKLLNAHMNKTIWIHCVCERAVLFGRSRPHYQRNVINKFYCLTFMEFSKRDWEKNKRTNLATTAEHISGDFFFYLIIKTEIYFFFRSFKDRIQLKQNQYFLVVYLIILQHAHRNQIGFFHV